MREENIDYLIPDENKEALFKEMEVIVDLLNSHRVFSKGDRSLEKANDLINDFERIHGSPVPESVQTQFKCIKEQYLKCINTKDMIHSDVHTNDFRKKLGLYTGVIFSEENRTALSMENPVAPIVGRSLEEVSYRGGGLLNLS